MKQNIEKLFQDIKNKLSIEWRYCLCSFLISRGGNNGDKAGMIKTKMILTSNEGIINNGDKRLLIKSKELKKVISEKFESKINNPKLRFNKIEVLFREDGSYTENYFWDEEKEKEDKAMAAKYFYQWLNETMMNRIFDYEKENNLLTPFYDEDGSVSEYESSWDEGIFVFNLMNNTVEYTIELIKNGTVRNLSMPLPEYIKDALLEHYEITNKELQDVWLPWNKLVIKSPNNSIPYDEWENFVTYSLEEEV